MKHPFKVEAAPILSKHLPDPSERTAPLMGEQSAEILRIDLGLTDAELELLIAVKVLERFKMSEEGRS